MFIVRGRSVRAFAAFALKTAAAQTKKPVREKQFKITDGTRIQVKSLK